VIAPGAQADPSPHRDHRKSEILPSSHRALDAALGGRTFKHAVISRFPISTRCTGLTATSWRARSGMEHCLRALTVAVALETDKALQCSRR